MRSNTKPRLVASGILAFSLFTAIFQAEIQAADPAGKVDASAGQVTAAGEDGAIRQLAKDAPFYSGDIISTGPNSRVRLLFSDNGVIFLRPSSRFEIKSYKHTGDKDQDESKFSLLRGGFRSVTGAIGQADTTKYEMETPVATIGIRGTDHEGRFCAGDCLDLVNIGVSAPPDGLYTGTNSGETLVGGQKFTAGQYGFTTPTGRTDRLPEPPPILIRDPALPNALADKGEKPAETSPAEGQQPQGQQGQPSQEQSGQNRDAGQEQPAKQGAVGQEPANQEQPAGQNQPLGLEQTPGPGQGQPPVIVGGEPPQPGEIFDIPARPPTTIMVNCR